MSGGSSMANKEILVKVPAHLGLASDTLLFRLDGEGTLPLATIGRLLPGAYLTYKDNKDKKVYPVCFDSEKSAFLFSLIDVENKIFEVACERKVVIRSRASWYFKYFALFMFIFAVAIFIIISVIYILTKGEKDNRSLMAAVLVSGFFAICLTINGILVGIFVIAMDNIDEMKRSTERLMHDLESLKQGTENLKLDETYKKLRNNGN
ncbi:hypothetical protein ACQ4LE_002545 [Meloidogyne hapla]